MSGRWLKMVGFKSDLPLNYGRCLELKLTCFFKWGSFDSAQVEKEKWGFYERLRSKDMISSGRT